MGSFHGNNVTSLGRRSCRAELYLKACSGFNGQGAAGVQLHRFATSFKMTGRILSYLHTVGIVKGHPSVAAMFPSGSSLVRRGWWRDGGCGVGVVWCAVH